MVGPPGPAAGAAGPGRGAFHLIINIYRMLCLKLACLFFRKKNGLRAGAGHLDAPLRCLGAGTRGGEAGRGAAPGAGTYQGVHGFLGIYDAVIYGDVFQVARVVVRAAGGRTPLRGDGERRAVPASGPGCAAVCEKKAKSRAAAAGGPGEGKGRLRGTAGSGAGRRGRGMGKRGPWGERGERKARGRGARRSAGIGGREVGGHGWGGGRPRGQGAGGPPGGPAPAGRLPGAAAARRAGGEAASIPRWSTWTARSA